MEFSSNDSILLSIFFISAFIDSIESERGIVLEVEEPEIDIIAKENKLVNNIFLLKYFELQSKLYFKTIRVKINKYINEKNHVQVQ